MFRRQFPKPSAEPLLRFVRNRDHASGLTFPPPRQRGTHTRPVLVMPRRFDQQASNQGVAGAGDPAAPMFLTAGVLARDQPEVRIV